MPLTKSLAVEVKLGVCQACSREQADHRVLVNITGISARYTTKQVTFNVCKRCYKNLVDAAARDFHQQERIAQRLCAPVHVRKPVDETERQDRMARATANLRAVIERGLKDA